MSKLDEQIPALLLSVVNVCITCWQLHFDFDLCLRVKSHKLLFWVPILAAGVKFNFWLYLEWCFPVRSFWIGIGCNYGFLVHLNYRALFCAIKSWRVGRQSRSCYDYAHHSFCKLHVLYMCFYRNSDDVVILHFSRSCPNFDNKFLNGRVMFLIIFVTLMIVSAGDCPML